jgi:hypothetical protein
MRALVLILSFMASPVLADRVTDRTAFVGLVEGKALTSLGVKLIVTSDGGISGRAFGRDVTGRWTWNEGYFCRTMQAGDRQFARNCQVVERVGDRIRFIADRGAGETADLRLP